jgi:uncharacterized 2Fe-2S/4Fe-4S cluster protein (DUF4445 family)
MMSQNCIVDFEPIGKRIQISDGASLLTAAQKIGADLNAICGGIGICGSCLVRRISGSLTPLTGMEKDILNSDQIRQEYRLACQAYPVGDVKIEIPPESLTSLQRLQIDGQESIIEVDPEVIALDINVNAPTHTDLRSDFTRVDQTIQNSGYPPLCGDLLSISQLSDVLRKERGKVRLAIAPKSNRTRLVSTFPYNTQLLGLAVDIGSTKLALYLVDLTNGITLAKTGVMNPQISYGEDIVSRIAFANQKADHRLLLQRRLVEALNRVISDLCQETGTQQSQIVDAVMVGNTVMHHFLCRLPVYQLGTAPYVAAVSEPLDFKASEIGLDLAIAAKLYTPANIAGYIGGDHTSVLVTLADHSLSHTIAVIDIGTNTEISLFCKGKIFSCSTASGPAFEGAHIHDGMRASSGAIEKVRISDGGISVTTIGNVPAVGICGTGILSAISEMLEHGIIDHRGVIKKESPCVRTLDRHTEVVLVGENESGTKKAVVVTRKDIHEIQLAKGAIRTGIDALLQSAGIQAGDVEKWVIAGAFGTYLDISSAIRIGMFPAAPIERFLQVGNAAGEGAKQMLLSKKKRVIAEEIVKQVNYIELTIFPGFSDHFIHAMYF